MPSRKGRDAIESCRELRDAVIEYVEPTVGSISTQVKRKVTMLVVDTAMRQKDLDDLQDSLLKALSVLDKNEEIGLITFDAVVKVYDLSKQECATAFILPGTRSPSQYDLNMLGNTGGVFAAPLHACFNTISSIIRSLKTPVRDGKRVRARSRCVGPAVEAAVAIVASLHGNSFHANADDGISPQGGKGHVSLVLGGPPTIGPGSEDFEVEASTEAAGMSPSEQQATEYFGKVGHRTRLLGISTDVLVVSMLSIGVQKLQAMTMTCGGEVVNHLHFGDAFESDLVNGMYRTGGRTSGVVDIHASACVEVLRIIGPLIDPATRQ